MLKLAGYADRLSVRPGETIHFHVAHNARDGGGGTVSARLVRVISADPNPAGPGIQVEPVASAGLVEEAAPAAERVPRGSYAVIEGGGHFAACRDLTVIVDLHRHVGEARESAVASLLETARHAGLGLGIDADGHVMASIGSGASYQRIVNPEVVVDDQWYRVWLSVDVAAQRARVGVVRLGRGGPEGAPVVVAEDVTFAGLAGLDTLLLAASTEDHDDPFRFNGRLASPAVFARALTDDAAVAVQPAATDGLVGRWDFAQDMSSSRIVDTGPHRLHGTLVNSPTRAVTGSNWTGHEMCWRHAPDQYGAIHFHDDDVDDCRWPVTHAWTLPAGIRTGQYALMLEAGGDAENIPFFVVPPKGKPTAKLAVLVSTFTYTVYGNHARPEWQMDANWQAAWRAQATAWGGYPHNPGDHGDYGYSTYNYHPDGSGVSLASWHRPMLNVRVGYLTYPFPEIRGSGLRHYPADTHLTAWLEAKGIAYDIITDWELHHEGLDILKDYKAVTTGTHPEYHTRQMLDALEAYKAAGGRFMYLGGNGFYWKIALNPERPGQIEIRRGEGGIRAWAADPGEYYNQYDGEYGGLWRRNGRPPQHLTGVGFTAQGNFVGSHYRLGEAARTSRAAWILDGLDGETLGGHGLSGHGAAGFELDRADKRLGTPPHAVILASSEDHPPEAPWILVPEERLTHIVTLPGVPEGELIRADLVFFETAGGKGAVFSTGSITWCGSLPTNGYDNDVSRLTENVLRRFLDPRPF